MWVFMDSDDTNFVGSNKEGIGKKLSCIKNVKKSTLLIELELF